MLTKNPANKQLKKRNFRKSGKKRTVKRIRWQKYIESNSKILLGKPIVKGTRLSVDFILSLFAEGWTLAQILENYPTLSIDSVKAVFAYSSECMKEESLYIIPKK
ncbi:DUF433 domain-containing protein [Candidatus Margulisiibacteriota bacterium]